MGAEVRFLYRHGREPVAPLKTMAGFTTRWAKKKAGGAHRRPVALAAQA